MTSVTLAGITLTIVGKVSIGSFGSPAPSTIFTTWTDHGMAVSKAAVRPKKGAQAVVQDVLESLSRLADDIGARLATTTDRAATDIERDEKLVAQLSRALEQLAALTAAGLTLETRNGDDDGSGEKGAGRGRMARDAEFRAALERRFDELRAARDGDGLSREAQRSGA